VGERITHGLVSIIPAAGWIRTSAYSDRHSLSLKGLRLFSPRESGTLTLDTITMPEDMGAFDVERLRKLFVRGDRAYIAAGMNANAFDERSWSADDVACVGRSKIDDPAFMMRGKLAARLRDESIDPKEQEAIAAYLSKGPTVHRDWYLARGTEMVNAWYRSERQAGAEDIADCEDMLRSIRFAPR
jgi:hypothetical protein